MAAGIECVQDKGLRGRKLSVGSMAKWQKDAVFQTAVTAAVVLLLAWHIFISYDYPYYFLWDMDFVTSLDAVLIQSGLLPDHICHPGFGMYLPLFFSGKIAHAIGVVSVLNLGDLAESLNPLVAMAELTAFVRLHSPFLVVGIAVLLGMAMQRMFGISRWYFFLFLGILGMQESLTYYSAVVRTELYSVFYWSGAVLTMALAVKAAGAVGRWLWVLGTGVLLGLCFLTKVQSLFYLAGLGVLLLIAFSIFRTDEKQRSLAVGRKGALWILGVSLFNVIAFLVLGIAAYSTAIPRGIPTWASAFCVTPMAVIFFLGLFLLFLCQLFLYLTNRVASDVFGFSCLFSVIAAGFILSFALHFLLYSDPAVSLQYILRNFKMMFLRQSKLLQLRDISVCLSDFLLYVYYNPTLFIVNIVLNVLLVVGCFFGFVRITKGQLGLCLLAAVIAFVNIAVATRFVLRDVLWKEVLVSFLSLFCFAIIVVRATRYRWLLVGVGTGLLVMLFFANCIRSYAMPARIDADFNHYGWRVDKWFKGEYGCNQRKYSEIMRRKYNAKTIWVAKNKAVEYRRIRRTVNFVFKNQAITHRNIGVAFKGFSVWCTDLDYRIAEVPAVLRGAILVDNASVRVKKTGFFKAEHVGRESGYLDKFKRPSSSAAISVLTRRDLRIFLFVHADDVSHLASELIVQTPYKIVLRNGEQSVELQGLELKNYCEIPLDKVRRKFFFVIREI